MPSRWPEPAAVRRLAARRPDAYHARWMRSTDALAQRHPPRPDRLRLVLGVGRSGTTWLAESLARSATPLSYLEEPYRRVRPRPVFATGDEPTALPYTDDPDAPAVRRLRRTLELLSGFEPDAAWLDPRSARRAEAGASRVLVKEVHALMGVEHVLARVACPTILIVRRFEPLLDSLMAHVGVGSALFREEYASLTATPFLPRCLPDLEAPARDAAAWIDREAPGPRVRDVLINGLAIGLLQAHFERLASRYDAAMLVRHDDLIESDPEPRFAEMAGFLGLTHRPGCHRAADRPHTTRTRRQLLERSDRFMTRDDWRWVERLRSRAGFDAPPHGKDA